MTTSSEKIDIEALDEETRNFYQFHGVQLAGSGFPPSNALVTRLASLLKNKVFNFSSFVSLADNEDDENFQFPPFLI